jgi:hypothetical protein
MRFALLKLLPNKLWILPSLHYLDYRRNGVKFEDGIKIKEEALRESVCYNCGVCSNSFPMALLI